MLAGVIKRPGRGIGGKREDEGRLRKTKRNNMHIFTTLRYTGTTTPQPVHSSIPLFERHVHRLASSWSHWVNHVHLSEQTWHDLLTAALEASIAHPDRAINLRVGPLCSTTHPHTGPFTHLVCSRCLSKIKASVLVDSVSPVIDIQTFPFESARSSTSLWFQLTTPMLTDVVFKAPYNDSLDVLQSQPSLTLPKVVVSPAPMQFKQGDHEFFTFKTSQRAIYDEHAQAGRASLIPSPSFHSFSR